MNSLFRVLLAAAVIVTALAPLGAQAQCDSWIDKLEAGYKITLDNRTYDAGSDTTKFCWTVEVDEDFSSTGKIKGLSHWVIGVCPGSTLVSASGPAAQGTLEVDPSTGLYGHKWDHAMESGESASYCITLDGNIPLSSSDMTFDGTATTKGGKICSTCDIDGPGCPRDCPDEECPPGQIRNADTCECECVNKDVPCPSDGQELNPDTCLCECIPDETCVDPKEQTEDCECLCKDRDVPCEFPGQERDADTCECECLAIPLCIAPAELVGCECVCDPSGTAEAECVAGGRFWNPEACSCNDDPPIIVCKTVKAKCGCPLVKDWDAVDCIKIVWVEDDTGRCDDAEDTD